MTSEQANVTPGSVPNELNNQRQGNDVDRRMESAELNEQIALVADIEITRHYPDVAGKWETTRTTSSNPRIRGGTGCFAPTTTRVERDCFSFALRKLSLPRNKITAM